MCVCVCVCVCVCGGGGDPLISVRVFFYIFLSVSLFIAVPYIVFLNVRPFVHSGSCRFAFGSCTSMERP